MMNYNELMKKLDEYGGGDGVLEQIPQDIAISSPNTRINCQYFRKGCRS